jgi:hypothetical protein
MKDTIVSLFRVGAALRPFSCEIVPDQGELKLRMSFARVKDRGDGMHKLIPVVNYIEKQGWRIRAFGIDPGNCPYIDASTLISNWED